VPEYASAPYLGLSQVLLLKVTPKPHVLEHEVQPDHSDQSPSLGLCVTGSKPNLDRKKEPLHDVGCHSHHLKSYSAGVYGQGLKATNDKTFFNALQAKLHKIYDT
jgi:hypothetical protein